MLQSLLAALMPHILEILAGVLTAVVTAVGLAARQYLTAKIGATNTEALSSMLHRALDTGVRAALAANPQADPGALVADAIDHAKASIPDTLAKLAPSRETLVNIARSKLVQVLR